MSQFPLPFNLDRSIASPLTGLNFDLAPIDWQQETEAAVDHELATTAIAPVEVQRAYAQPATLSVRRTATANPQLSLAPIEQSSQLRSDNLLLGQVSTLVQTSPQQTPRFATPAMLEWQALLFPAIDLALTQLQAFAQSPAFAETLRLSFGEEVNVQRARPLINRLTLIGHPTNPLGRIQVISDPPLDISGAYAPDTKTIYLTAAFLNNNATDPGAVAAALLEEIGHHLDATLNRTDRPGDEGELFSALVQGRSIDAAELLRLQAEDDTAILLLNGQAVLVEQSTGVTLSGDASSNTLRGSGGNDFLYGRAGNDLLLGLGGNDQLFGGLNNDELDGGLGSDFLYGEGGDDTLIGWDGNDRLFGDTGNDELRGSAGDDYLAGDDGNDRLFGADGVDDLRGQAGDDYLVGGDGADLFRGGTGNDIYVVDRASESITEEIDQGIDWVHADLSYTLGSNLENLALLGTAEWIGNGNDLNNSISGNSSRNVIQGLAGNDGIAGGAGNDDLYGNTGFDILYGGEGDDRLQGWTEDDQLFGETGNDLLFGEVGNDYLDGSTGADTLSGGEGNDTLSGGTENDFLYGDAGSDTLYGDAGNDWLEGRTEDDRLFGGEGSDTLQGQVGNDRLDGGSGGDLLIGGFGNDVYVVDNFADIVQEFIGEGTDWVEAGISYFLGSQVENLALTGTASINGTGNELNNFLQGNAGDNQLDGGVGFDTLVGGAGNDIYIVDSSNDVVSETDPAGGVRDIVRSSVTYNLGNNLETLELTGTAAINGTGNDLSNTLVGNVNNNTLIGGAGNDWINGSGGIDRLTGGTGVDRFVLGTAAASFYDDGSDLTIGIRSYALITDFNPEGDIIELQGATISGSSLQIQGAQAADYFLAVVPPGMPFGTGTPGTGIYRNKPGSEPDELLGIINIPNRDLFNLGALLPVVGGDTRKSPANADPDERLVRFELVSAGGENEWLVRQRWDGRQVWIVLHGWNGDYFQFERLAESVGNAKPNDIVLALDWTKASGGFGLNDQGFNNVGDIGNGGNLYAANWIGPVADVISEQLRRWGIQNGSSLNFIGHSLGSLLSSELAFRFGVANTITALDPPSELNRLTTPDYSSGYRYLRNGQQEVTPVRFDTVSSFSRSFVGRASFAGNKEFARWADEAVLMDFRRNVDFGEEHGYVIDAFQKLIDPIQSPHLARELFSLNDYEERQEEFRLDAYERDFNNNGFEGVLEVDSGNIPEDDPKNVLYFTAFNGESSGAFDQYIYGTSEHDNIDLSFGNINGRVVDIATLSGNHIYYGGKGNDRISGEFFATSAIGNDKMFGDEGNDTLDGRAGKDTLAGVNPNTPNPGRGEVDNLIGGSDSDTFVLGDTRKVYYTGQLTNDFALIKDFNPSEGDIIQLRGQASNYSLIQLDASAENPGTAIYRNSAPLDVFLLPDVSRSFSSNLNVIRDSVPNLVRELRGTRPDTLFGVGSFVDKPLPEFEFGGEGDYVYRTDLPLTANESLLQNTVDNLAIYSGFDGPEAQLEALFLVAKRSGEIGFRNNSFRVVVLFTDDSYHRAGDGAKVGLFPNNGDALIDPREDYPSITQVREALRESNIIPIFTVTRSQQSTYQDLVTRLGVGTVVDLRSDGSALASAVSSGITNVGTLRELVGIVQGNPTPLSLTQNYFSYV